LPILLHLSLSHFPIFYYHSFSLATKGNEKGACWKIGNGIALYIWNAPWVPQLKGFNLKPRIASLNNFT